LSDIDLDGAHTAKLIGVRRWRHGPEWHPKPHSHPFCEIIIVLQGAERARVNGKLFVCETGQVLLYPPGQVHEEWLHSGPTLEFYCVEFHWRACPKQMPSLIVDRQGRVRELARWLNNERLLVYAGDETYRNLLLRMLVGELVRLVVSPSQEVVDRVRAFVRENLKEEMGLDDLAASCGLNKYHLVRKFRHLTGLTPMEYVRSVRLETAHRLLMETSLPLREIAPCVGLGDEYHLSRLLKSRYGRGARELRRQMKAEGA